MEGGAHRGEEEYVAEYAEGGGEDKREEARLVAVGETGAGGIDEGAPEVDGDDEVLGLGVFVSGGKGVREGKGCTSLTE